MTLRSCPTCAGYDAELVHHLELQAPDDHPLAGGYDVVSCRCCGTGFADVEIDDAYYDEYYAARAKYALEATTRLDGPTSDPAEPTWVLDRFEDQADHVARLVPDPEARILDIGCATGNLLAALDRRGYRQLVGIDPSRRAAQIAATQGIRVVVGTFADFPVALGTFDVVCLTGVLEHLWDVDGAMTTALRHLREDGVIYATVPDASRYLDPYIAPFQDFSTEHVNHFSPATLEHLGRRFGMQTVWSGPADARLSPRSPCAAVAVAWQRLASGSRGRRDTRQPIRGIAVDATLVKSLKAFTERSMKDFATIDGILEAELADTDSYAVWGFGEFTMKLLARPALARRRLLAAVDGNPARHGTRVRGVTVRRPEDLSPGRAPIVIGSVLSEDPILAELARLGHTNPTVSLTRAFES